MKNFFFAMIAILSSAVASAEMMTLTPVCANSIANISKALVEANTGYDEVTSVEIDGVEKSFDVADRKANLVVPTKIKVTLETGVATTYTIYTTVYHPDFLNNRPSACIMSAVSYKQ